MVPSRCGSALAEGLWWQQKALGTFPSLASIQIPRFHPVPAMTAPGITINTYSREGTKCHLFPTSVSSALPTPCSFPGLSGASASRTPDIYLHLRSQEVKDILFTPNPGDLMLLPVELGYSPDSPFCQQREEAQGCRIHCRAS